MEKTKMGQLHGDSQRQQVNAVPEVDELTSGTLLGWGADEELSASVFVQVYFLYEWPNAIGCFQEPCVVSRPSAGPYLSQAIYGAQGHGSSQATYTVVKLG